MRINYLTYYRLAAEQFRESGAKISVWFIFWMGLAFFSPFLVFNYGYLEYLKIAFGFADSVGAPVIGNSLVSLILANIFFSIVIYSMMGVIQQTGDDPDASWLRCGIQGLLHPWRAISVSFVILVVSLLYFVLAFLCALGMVFIIPFVGGFIAAIFLIVTYAAYLYGITGIGYSWFLMLDDNGLGGVSAIRNSIEEVRGRRLPMLGLLLPVVIATVLVGIGLSAAYVEYLNPRLVEGQLALQTYQEVNVQNKSLAIMHGANNYMLTETEKAHYERALAHEIYSQPAPVYEQYEDDFGAYVSALARYGMKREMFMAVRENRQVDDLVQSYIDHPAGSLRWGALSLFLAVIECLLIAFAFILLFKMYRERLPLIELEQDPEMQKHPEALLHGELGRPDMLTVDPNAPAAGVPMIPAAVTKPKPVVMARPVVEIDPGFELQLHDSQTPSKDDTPDTETPSATSQPSEVADLEQDPDSIDPGFSLKF